jgi:hypothetical protein
LKTNFNSESLIPEIKPERTPQKVEALGHRTARKSGKM